MVGAAAVWLDGLVSLAFLVCCDYLMSSWPCVIVLCALPSLL